VRNYAIDGLHLDRIRYPELGVSGQTPSTGTNIGYNPISVDAPDKGTAPLLAKKVSPPPPTPPPAYPGLPRTHPETSIITRTFYRPPAPPAPPSPQPQASQS